MPVRIGDLEIIGAQSLGTEENRNLVEQRVPGQSGNAVQDLGRGPVTITLEGLILGEQALDSLEKLRQAHSKAEPLPFSSDIAAGTDVTDVIIEDLQARQIAGYKSRYWFTLRVREHIEPPESPLAGQLAVNAGISGDADNWAGGALGASSVLQSPGSAAGALSSQPGLLDHLSMGDLGSSISGAVGDLTGGDFGNIIKSISEIDPGQAIEMVGELIEGGSLGQLMQKYAQEGLDVLEGLTGIDFGLGESLIKGLMGATEFFKRLEAISEAAGDLVDALEDFDPLAGIRSLTEKR